ncbi:hypothetical protein [Actinacidiphila rubida]|nr:hypothetical protein [Actinacidiphila rubida]
MKIDPDDKHTSTARRWGVPLGIAAGVAAMSIGAVAVFGGEGAAAPVRAGAGAGGSATSPAASPSQTHVSPSAGTGSAGTRTAPATPGSFTVTSTTTTPIDAGTVARILASCLGSDASRYHAVIAVRTPVATRDWDGAVVAVDSGGRYVQCETKGDRGTSQDVPPTFINDRLWGTGHLVEYFDSTGGQAGPGKYLSLGAGHVTSKAAKVTISYGEDRTEYPAVLGGGAFFYAAAFSGTASAHTPFSAATAPYVHAYDAAGKEIYDQTKDPRFTGTGK